MVEKKEKTVDVDKGTPYPNGYNPVQSLRDAFAAVDAKIEADEAEEKWKIAHDQETQAKRAEGERVWQKIHRLTIGELSDFSREEIEAIAEIDDHIEAWKGDKTKLLKHINRVLTNGADTKEGL